MNAHEQLKAYLDHELSPQERTQVEQSLASSSELREELAQLQRLADALTGLRETPPPTGREGTLRAVRLAARPTPWMQSSKVWRSLAAVGALGLLVVFAITPLAMKSTSMAKSGSVESAVTEVAMAEQPASAMPMDAESASAQPDQARFRTSASGERTQMKAQSNEGIAMRPDVLERSIIRTAVIGVRVSSVPDSVVRVTDLVKSQRGFIEASSTMQEERFRRADMTLRVPSAQFDSVLLALRGLGEVTSESTSGQDVTAQVVDAEARLRVLRTEESSLIEILRRTRRLGEVLAIRDRLSNTRAQIESLDAQRKALREMAALSTINLNLTERPAPVVKTDDGWAIDAWTSAVNGLKEVGRFLGQAVIFLIVFSPIWLLPLGISVWLARRNR